MARVRMNVCEVRPTRVVHAIFPNGTLGAMRVIDGDCTIQELVITKEAYPEMTVACLGAVDLTSDEALPGVLGYCKNGTRRAATRGVIQEPAVPEATCKEPSITG